MVEEVNAWMLKGVHAEAIARKAQQTLLGLCHGLIADNELNEQEFFYLRQWLIENECFFEDDWLVKSLREKVEDILSDGQVTSEELEHLKGVLSQAVGSTCQETGQTSSRKPTTLPVDRDIPVLFPDQKFCFTGDMAHGTRKKCTDETESRGGLVIGSVRKDLNYLVIGSTASAAWVNGSYGIKIQKAIGYKEKGSPLFIITEDMWRSAIKDEPVLTGYTPKTVTTYANPRPDDRKAAIVWARKLIENPEHWVILDTETTGLGEQDEIIQISVIDAHGNCLLDTLVKPKRKTIPARATAIHGLTMEMLKDAPTFEELVPDFMKAIGGRLPVIYNAGYDERLLDQTAKQFCEGLRFKSTECAMRRYSAYVGKQQRLPGGDHTALGDCKATLALIRKMAESN